MSLTLINPSMKLQTGELVRLSSQELVDCSWGEGNNGCDGGEDFRAYQWIMKHGLASEEDYGAYLGQVCHFSIFSNCDLSKMCLISLIIIFKNLII